MTAGQDLYEAVRYPGHPFPQTHPDRLFTVGVLHGLEPAPPDDCSVLELGCGDGMNLVAMAAELPGLRALGIDRAAGPLEHGRELAGELGLENVELRAGDLLGTEDLGTFDYVVAHGVYSWVPGPVRDALLALAARSLAPHGLAFVSYNALPGCHVRRTVRDLMRFHVGGRDDASDPATRAALAREALGFAARFENRSDAYGRAFEAETERLQRLTDNSLLHDDLGEVWDPSYLADFVVHAGRHDLSYVADAELSELQADRFPPGVEDALAEIGGEDPVRREQYGDFLSGRPFRQTVLAPAAAAPARESVSVRLHRLRFSSTARPDPVGGSYASPVDAALAALADRHPGTATLAELAHAAGAEPAALAPGLLGAFRTGLLAVHARDPAWATDVPQRPSVSPLARCMARDGVIIPTLDHSSYRAEDPVSRRLLTLMDGTRDRAALIQGLLDSVGREIVVESEDGEPVALPLLREPFAEHVDADLARFAGAALIRKDAGDVAAA